MYICMHWNKHAFTHTHTPFIATISVFEKISCKGRVNPVIYLTSAPSEAQSCEEKISGTPLQPILPATKEAGTGPANWSSQGILAAYQ